MLSIYIEGTSIDKMINNPDRFTLVNMMSGSMSTDVDSIGTAPESTFTISDSDVGPQSITSAFAQVISDLQDESIESSNMIQIDGWISDNSRNAVHARVLVSDDYPHIAMMAKAMLYPMHRSDTFTAPEITVICTPGFSTPRVRKPTSGGFTRFMSNTLILVDSDDEHTTRVMGTDSFGEVRAALIRSWSDIMADKGSIALNASLKSTSDKDGTTRTVAFVGESNSGKTTLSMFGESVLGDDKIIQDDYFALNHDGTSSGLESSVFTRTYDIDEANTIVRKELENPENLSENIDSGGSIILPRSQLGGRAFDTRKMGEIVTDIFFLSKLDGVKPPIQRLTVEQAVAAFATDACTNDLTSESPASQSARLYEMLRANPEINLYSMNTGSTCEGLCNTSSEESMAIVRAVLNNNIMWSKCPHLGIETCMHEIPGLPIQVMNPKVGYLRDYRGNEYEALCGIYVDSRVEKLASISYENKDVIDAISTVEPVFRLNLAHKIANEAGDKSFLNEDTGQIERTESSYWRQGYCCGDPEGNNCKYCPWKD